jgi:hypothetical protein
LEEQFLGQNNSGKTNNLFKEHMRPTLREYINVLEKRVNGLKALAACKSGLAVAELLAKKKITGETGSIDDCPIANYLKSIGFGEDTHTLDVSGNGAEITVNDDTDGFAATTGIDKFIESFDALDERDEEKLASPKRKPFAKLMA